MQITKLRKAFKIFTAGYHDWNSKRAKSIVDFYGYKFFYFKRVLDLGSGHGDVGGVLYRLGSDVTAVDCRQEHLKVVSKKYSGIKVVQANLDIAWPFHGKKWDLTLDLGLICHLADYETHLKQVCQSTNHLILETAVTDSDSPTMNTMVDEDKNIYDLAFGGKGCRPSAAAIERVLKENGMNFKRMDNSKFNTADYIYDWYPKNDNSTSISKRRIWFCVKETNAAQFANPASEIAAPPVVPQFPQGFVPPIRHGMNRMNRMKSPQPPMSARIEAETQAAEAAEEAKLALSTPVNKIRTHKSSDTLNDKVRFDSRNSSLITQDNFIAPITTELAGIIYPNTISSKMWYKKISPLLPNIKLSQKVISMPEFDKSDKNPDIIMCSLYNLQAYNKIWVDEWFSPELTAEHIEVLKKCNTIITPSLINAQEILKYIPNANVKRMCKPWPLIQDISIDNSNYFIYFEKSPELTKVLFEAWEKSYDNLIVVGSSQKVPSFATFVSDSEGYEQIIKLIMGSKGLIDLSENNFYHSGLLKLANAISLPIVSNNHIKLDTNTTLIQQDKQLSPFPTIDHIKQALNVFIDYNHSKPIFNETYNQSVLDDIGKIIGS